MTVAFGKAQAFEERSARFNEVLETQPGFQARRILSSLGCPANYTMIVFWDSREAQQAATRSAAVQAYIEANPPVPWATVIRPVEAYEEVHTTEGQQQGTPGQVTLIDWTLHPGMETGDAFEASRREYAALLREHHLGLFRFRLLRYLGAPNRYLAITASTNREAIREALRQPEIQRFNEAHPWSKYAPAPPVLEAHEPVRVAVPA
jgi:heme-degrading monooxygenase HmoA